MKCHFEWSWVQILEKMLHTRIFKLSSRIDSMFKIFSWIFYLWVFWWQWFTLNFRKVFRQIYLIIFSTCWRGNRTNLQEYWFFNNSNTVSFFFGALTHNYRSSVIASVNIVYLCLLSYLHWPHQCCTQWFPSF